MDDDNPNPNVPDSSSKKRGVKPRKFETALSEIERIVGELEHGQLDLDEALTQYQRGIETLKECHQLLSAAERKITLLSGFDAEGNPVQTEFDEAEMSLDEKQSKRTARRTAERPPSNGGQLFE